MTKKKIKKADVSVISWCCNHKCGRSLENITVVHARKCPRLSENIGYLVISRLFLLNVTHQRVYQAGHLSHFLSRPLVHWAQIPINATKHIQNRNLGVRGLWGKFFIVSLLWTFHSFFHHLLKACLIFFIFFFSFMRSNLNVACKTWGDTTKFWPSTRHGQNTAREAFWSSFAISLLSKVIMWPFNLHPLTQFMVMYK